MNARAPARDNARAPGWRRAWPFVAPALIVYGALVVYPTVAVLRFSLYRWDGVSAHRTFVGLANFAAAFLHDPIFWRSVGNSALWTILSVLIPTGLGLGLAVVLNRPMPGRTTFRTLFYLPAVIASIAVAAIWSWLYNPTFGLVPATLEALHLPSPDWLGDRNLALFSVFAASAWAGTGTNMLLFLAGLQTVPRELEEAARVDGAGRWQVFWHATLPSLRPTFTVVISLAIINSLKAFDLIFGMTAGGPGDASQVLASWSYTQAFNFRHFGEGAAIAVVLLVLTLAVVVPYLRWSARED